MYAWIQKRALELAPVLSACRRQLHAFPEPAWEERRTCAFLEQELQKLGYEVLCGRQVSGHDTGILATLRCGSGPVFALRFDLDALPVEESSDPAHRPQQEGFRSCCPGIMHACGHDGHAAIGLGCAHLLKEMQDRLHGTIRLIFQPAEEGARGAAPIVEKGWLDDVSWFLAGHIVGRDYGGPEHADAVPVCSSLATTKFDVLFRGRSCHGAQPENGASVLSAMAAVILALNGIPRHSKGATFLNVGTVSAGKGRNIVAGEGRMEAEVRGADTELNQYMEDRAFSLIRSGAAMYGCEALIRTVGKAPSLQSSPGFCRELSALCRDNLPLVRMASVPEVFRASEDAAVMLDAVRSAGGEGAFLLFPTRTAAPLHSPDYDFDEAVLPKAAALFASAVFRFCGGIRPPQDPGSVPRPEEDGAAGPA